MLIIVHRFQAFQKGLLPRQDFLKLEKVKAKTLEPNFCHAKLFLFKNTNKHPQTDYFISGSSNLTEAGIGLKETNNESVSA